MKLHAAKLVLASWIAAAAVAGAVQAQGVNQNFRPKNNVLARALDIEMGKQSPRVNEPRLSSGTLYAVLAASGELGQRADAGGGNGDDADKRRGGFTQGCPNTFKKGDNENVRVNQDCSLRRQAEATLAINPTNPDNMIAGQNDSRIGFNHCGYDFTFDGGKTWGDMVPPFYQFILKDGHTADACSDPTATFDATGNAYIGGVLFDIDSAASAFVVMKSNAGINGAFYHTPKPLPFQTYRDTPVGLVANDNDPNIFHDKEFIIADAGKASPKKNNVYATWTRFDFNTGAGDGAHSPIYFSQSLDGGATWTKGIEISGRNAAACTVFSGEADSKACDQDQGSDPVVGKDGTIYVSFNNGNTLGVGIQQQLFVKCPANKDCSLVASWTAPVKIADDIATQPIGPSAAGCPSGRQCLPPNGYRMNDFGALSVDDSGKLYFVWSDFRNGGGACPPLGNAATIAGGCDNDVFYSYSTNGGATWSTPFNIAPKAKVGASAQWQAWGAVAPDGKTLFVAYYDRSYGNCETTGCNDITLASIKDPASASPKVSYQRVTTSSMPNLVPANNPIQAGFLGDYMWLAVDANGQPNIVWSDTRGLNGSVEEDIYFARPNGNDNNND